MKKTSLWILIFTMLLSFTACEKEIVEDPADPSSAGNNESTKNEEVLATEAPISATAEEPLSISLSSKDSDKAKRQISDYIKRLVDGYDGAKLESITVMQDYNIPDTVSYRVYAISTYSRQGEPQELKNTLVEYSNTISSIVNTYLENVQGLSLTWRSTALDGAGVVRYEKTDGFLESKEEAFDKKFGATEPAASPDGSESGEIPETEEIQDSGEANESL